MLFRKKKCITSTRKDTRKPSLLIFQLPHLYLHWKIIWIFKFYVQHAMPHQCYLACGYINRIHHSWRKIRKNQTKNNNQRKTIEGKTCGRRQTEKQMKWAEMSWNELSCMEMSCNVMNCELAWIEPKHTKAKDRQFGLIFWRLKCVTKIPVVKKQTRKQDTKTL